MKQYVRRVLTALVQVVATMLIFYVVGSIILSIMFITLLSQAGRLNPEASASVAVAVKELEEYLNQFPPPTEATRVSSVGSVYCCGNGNHDSADIIVSYLYSTPLSQSEIVAHYETYNKAVLFVDESLFRSRFYPCAYYNIVEQHDLQPEMIEEQTLYFFVGWDAHVHPDYAYCH